MPDFDVICELKKHRDATEKRIDDLTMRITMQRGDELNADHTLHARREILLKEVKTISKRIEDAILE